MLPDPPNRATEQKRCFALLDSHLFLLVCKIVTRHHDKVLPPSKTSRHRHVLLLEVNVNVHSRQQWGHLSCRLLPYKVIYLSDVPKQLPFSCEQGVVCKSPPPCNSHALACCVDGSKLHTNTHRYHIHILQKTPKKQQKISKNKVSHL